MRYELAICAVGHPTQPWRMQEGDIMAIHPVQPGLTHEQDTRLIWVQVELDPADVPDLTEEGDDGRKRRYSLPFLKLKELVPTFDETKARDKRQAYQLSHAEQPQARLSAITPRLVDRKATR